MSRTHGFTRPDGTVEIPVTRVAARSMYVALTVVGAFVTGGMAAVMFTDGRPGWAVAFGALALALVPAALWRFRRRILLDADGITVATIGWAPPAMGFDDVEVAALYHLTRLGEHRLRTDGRAKGALALYGTAGGWPAWRESMPARAVPIASIHRALVGAVRDAGGGRRRLVVPVSELDAEARDALRTELLARLPEARAIEARDVFERAD